jgi:transcriptional regulator with XRE-family HTH domain
MRRFVTMAARSSSRRPFAWTEKRFGEDVLPDKRRLAAELQGICRHLVIRAPDGMALTHPTQAQAARHLNISETALSRYLHGQHVPPDKVTSFIFDTACHDAGEAKNLGITKGQLLELRARAEQERCGNCSRHREAVRTAGQKLKAMQENQERLERTAEEKDRALREAREQASALKHEAQRAKAAQPVTEAGPHEDWRASRTASLLPVPRRQGDRQQSKNETAAAQNIASRAKELLDGGRPDSTLALLRHTTEAYTPAEMALLVALLRTGGHHVLADNLVHIYGRDRSDGDVVRGALMLHEHEAVADAEMLLRAAAARSDTARSRVGRSGLPS